jgi:type IV pilus assembly protein PilM
VSAKLNIGKARTANGVRPPAAVELTPEGVLAAALPRRSEQEAVYAFRPLPAGALVAGVEEPNLRAAGAVTEAISGALEDVAPRTRAVTLVLPDTSLRVFVLDFDTLPDKVADVAAVLRFRLRKMVHFDVEKAGVSYQVLSESRGECRVLIATVAGPILAEYEGAVRAAGYEPGAVLPSSLAALATLKTDEPVLAACLSNVSLTTSITRGEDLLLYRTLDLPRDPGDRLSQVQKDIAVAAAYFEDKLSTGARRLYYGGIGSAEEFGRWIRTNGLELNVVDLVERPTTGVATSLGRLSLASITGALAGAA